MFCQRQHRERTNAHLTLTARRMNTATSTVNALAAPTATSSTTLSRLGVRPVVRARQLRRQHRRRARATRYAGTFISVYGTRRDPCAVLIAAQSADVTDKFTPGRTVTSRRQVPRAVLLLRLKRRMPKLSDMHFGSRAWWFMPCKLPGTTWSSAADTTTAAVPRLQRHGFQFWKQPRCLLPARPVRVLNSVCIIIIIFVARGTTLTL
jgi:hypothetical protein